MRKRGIKRTDISGEKVRISKEQMRHIHKSIRWGYKKELCNIMGISACTLSIYLAPKKVYNRELMKDEEIYSLYKEDYETILKFINTIPVE